MDAYDLDDSNSDSDSDEPSVKVQATMQDIEKLREKTVELLDPQWKDARNKHLLSKMLDLEEPMITGKMVDFMLQEGVCETLIGFITQVGSSHPRPGPQDAKTEALKLSFRATSLLAPDDPSEPLLMLMGKRAGLMVRLVFDIFREDSSGSFFHAQRLLEALLRFYPAESYDGMCSDGKATERMASLLRYVGYPIVGEIFVMVVALTPVSRMSPLYTQSAKSRWAFFEQISQWTMLLRVIEVVVKPASSCCVSGYIDADAHSAAACQLFQDLVEKLSLEETGELLLQPIGYTSALLDSLATAATSSTEFGETRRNALRLLCFLLRRCAEPEIVCLVGAAMGANATPTCVPNCLFPLRERVITHLDGRMVEVVESLVKFSPPDERAAKASGAPVAYSAYTIAQPFTITRVLLVELIVLMVESDELMSGYLTADAWQSLIGWTVKYANNNIYHALFYRLIFAVLRQSQEDAQKVLFQKAKFATFLMDAFLPYTAGDGIGRHSTDAEGNPIVCPPTTRGAPADLVNRVVARGLVMNCANAIRLHAAVVPRNSFIRTFLDTNAKWAEFISGDLMVSE